MTYGLTNRLLVRKDKPGEPQAGAPREFLNVSVRQSYYTDANASQFDTQYSYGFQVRAANPFSPISLDGAGDCRSNRWRLTTGSSTTRRRCRARPKLLGTNLNGTLRTEADQCDRRLEPAGLCAADAPSGFVSEARTCVNAQSDFRLKQSRFGGRVEFQYDFATSTLLNQRYVGFYNAQCCGVSFEYQSFNYSNQVASQLPDPERPALQHVVHPGRRRLVLELLRGVRRRHGHPIGDFTPFAATGSDKIDRSHEGPNSQRR